MSKEAIVEQIFISPDKGVPMVPLETVQAIAGVGLEGDRYALGIGAFSKGKRQVIRHVSLVGLEAIEESNTLAEEPFLPSETRRNIVTSGIDLNELVGESFYVGDVEMRGVELCDPCGRPSKLAGKPRFQDAFENRGGLRAEVLSSGLIAVHDTIRVA